MQTLHQPLHLFLTGGDSSQPGATLDDPSTLSMQLTEYDAEYIHWCRPQRRHHPFNMMKPAPSLCAQLAFFSLLPLPASPPAPFPVRSLMDLSKKPAAPELKDALISALHESALDNGTAWMGEGTDFIWAVRTPGAHPSLEVDGKPRPPMKRIPGTDIWFATGSVSPAGKLHFFEYKVDGKQFGGNTQVATTDYTKAVEFPVFGPDSYPRSGVPQGKLSEKLTFTSKLYDGMTDDYWIYVPAQYDPNTPAALMVFQDGQGYVDRDSARNRTLDVLDNLIAQKKIPVMIGVFISPGQLSNPDSPMYKELMQRAASRGGRGGRGAGTGANAGGTNSGPQRSRCAASNTTP